MILCNALSSLHLFGQNATSSALLQSLCFSFKEQTVGNHQSQFIQFNSYLRFLNKFVTYILWRSLFANLFSVPLLAIFFTQFATFAFTFSLPFVLALAFKFALFLALFFLLDGWRQLWWVNFAFFTVVVNGRRCMWRRRWICGRSWLLLLLLLIFVKFIILKEESKFATIPTWFSLYGFRFESRDGPLLEPLCLIGELICSSPIKAACLL